jgi:glycosyltransferase involved in cell wall biosynthesis
LKNILAYNITKQSDVLSQLQGFNKKISDEAIYRSIKDKHQLALPKVSAVIITYNEDAIIGQTLSKLDWCDEVIIIDSGSTDKTVEICKEYGCIIFYRSFNGFGEQKKYGVSKAKNDWVLFIDADELLSESLIEEIQEEISKKDIAFAGFEMCLNLVFMNRVFKYGKETKCYRIRLFNKNSGDWDGSVVHEKVILNGPVKRLKNDILHYSYTNYSQFLKKIDLYSTLGAKQLLNRKSSKNKFLIVLGIPFNFFKYYIIDRNFLNGYQGLTWAIFNSLYHLVKYLKLDELKARNS